MTDVLRQNTTQEGGIWACNPVEIEKLKAVDLAKPGSFRKYFLSGDGPFVWLGEPYAMNRRLIAQSLRRRPAPGRRRNGSPRTRFRPPPAAEARATRWREIRAACLAWPTSIARRVVCGNGEAEAAMYPARNVGKVTRGDSAGLT